MQPRGLDGGGLTRDDVTGKPFWETFWWTVTPKTQEDLRDAIRRAAQGESIPYDVEVYARKSGVHARGDGGRADRKMSKICG